MNSRQLIVWCADAAKNLKRMFQSRNTSILTSEKALSEVVSIWISVAEAALQSTLRFWALSSINTLGSLSAVDPSMVSGSNSEGNMKFCLETVRLVGVMVMEAGEIICCCTKGNALIYKCIDILTTVGYEVIAMKGLKSIISSAYCLKGSRGQWCARLVKFAVTLFTEEEEKGKKTMEVSSDDDDDDEEEEEEKKGRVIAKINNYQCESIYQFIESVLHSHPELLVDANINSYYDIVLSIEMEAATSIKYKIKNDCKKYEFVSIVAKKAIENCPYVHSFWDRYESILRLQGNHKDANHIRWRRERESNP